MLNSKKGAMGFWGIAIIVIIGIAIFSPQTFNNVLSSFGGGGGTTTTTTTSTGGDQCFQQTDGTNTLNVAVKEEVGTTLTYLNNAISAEYDDATTAATGTATASTSLTYTALNVAPCKTGQIYALGSTTNNGAKLAFSSFPLTSEYIINNANSSRLTLEMYNAAYTANGNATILGGIGGYIIGTTAGGVVMGTGSSISGFIDLRSNQTVPGAFGSKDGGIIVAYDAGDNTIFSSTGSFSLASGDASFPVNVVTCPEDVQQARSADMCWKAPRLTSNDGFKRLSYTLKADNGDPTPTNTTRVWFIDENYFRDTNGVVEQNAYNSAGTDQGTADTFIVFFLA